MDKVVNYLQILLTDDLLIFSEAKFRNFLLLRHKILILFASSLLGPRWDYVVTH